MPRTIPDEYKTKAFDLYCQGKSHDEIIEKVPMVTRASLASWVTKEGWLVKKNEFQRKVVLRSAEEFATFISKERINTAVSHFRQTCKIETKILEKIEEYLGKSLDEFKPRDLQYLIKSYKDIADLRARATGLTDRLFQPKDTNSDGKRSMMNVNIEARLKDALPERKPIDTDCSETNEKDN